MDHEHIKETGGMWRAAGTSLLACEALVSGNLDLALELAKKAVAVAEGRLPAPAQATNLCHGEQLDLSPDELHDLEESIQEVADEDRLSTQRAASGSSATEVT